MENIKLTDFARASGCGCKINPKALEQILKNVKSGTAGLYPNLLVGNDKGDDAAVMDLGNGTALISTTDFFTPIVNDAYQFGYISGVNAINDVYAMGGKPLMALAILGWPLDRIPLELAGVALEGARDACVAADIPLSGGHSIDSLEPFLGLSVNGLVEINNIKRNSGAQENDLIYMTKPLGTGVLSAAEKRGILEDVHQGIAAKMMMQMNMIGASLGSFDYIHAMTDVTGFGFLGHLIEMCDGANLSAEINGTAIPVLDEARFYLTKMCYPDGTLKNWSSFSDRVSLTNPMDFLPLCDPQTSGGLMVAVAQASKSEFEDFMSQNESVFYQIGKFTALGEKAIKVM
jgi:selenide, water dikinase